MQDRTKKLMLKAADMIGTGVMFTGIVWLSYYPICWVNKLGLLLRGSIITVDGKSSMDVFVNNLSSLGIIFFIVILFSVEVALDE